MVICTTTRRTTRCGTLTRMEGKHLQNLIGTFSKLKSEWRSKISEDEWFFSSFRENFTSKLDSRECMDAFNFVIRCVLPEKDVLYANELCDLLLCLARKSGTTEIPAGLKENFLELNALFMQNDYQRNVWEELKAYYML